MASSASHHPDERPVPCPSNPILLASQAQWLFTDEELTRTPSQLDGMKFEAEHTSRSKGVNFITQVGIMLKLPQLTIATAAVYLHRFFMRYSMVDIPRRPGLHPYPIAATSLFLATKVEENVRRMREIVVACCRVAQKQPNMLVDEQSKEFWKWRDTILHHEDLLLESLCFDLQLEQPYRLLYDFMCFFGMNENKSLRNASWAFVNDSMFTVLCLQFHARTIAAAALYAAARHCDLSFEDDARGRPWWEQIDVDLTQVRRACSRLAQLYESNVAQRHSQHYPTTPIASDEGAEKTRRQRPGVAAASSETPSGPPKETEVNGRKRSRDAEEARVPSETPNPPLNGQRSPKRQRLSANESVESKSTVETPASQPSASTTFSSHGTTVPDPPPSTQDSHLNGYHHHPPPPHTRPQHQQPPIPRVPKQYRQTSPQRDNHNVDPVQQRIDQIVHQNPPAAHTDDHKPPKYDRRQSADHYRPRDRDRDRDRDTDRGRGRDRDRDHHRDRRSASPTKPRKPSLEKERSPEPPHETNTNHRRRHRSPSHDHDDHPPDSPTNEKHPPPPPPPPPPPREEEASGSEEGELV